MQISLPIHTINLWLSVCVCIYIYIYIYIEECIFRQQVVIKASFIKDNGTLFVYHFQL